MGQTNAPFISRNAGADHTGNLYKIVKQNSGGDVILSAAGTDRHIGVLQSEDKLNMPVSVRVVNADGTGLVFLGGTVSAIGTELTADSTGRAVAATTGDWVIGLAQATGAVGDQIEYLGVYYKK